MGVHRESGDGWWYAEKTPDDEAAADDDAVLDWSILQNPHFIAAVLGVLVAQALVAVWVLRDSRREKRDKAD